MICFITFGVVFIGLGVAMAAMSSKIVEVSVRYDDQCQLPDEERFGSFKPCSVTLDVPTQIEGPIYVYYELDNFYQNHRRYVRSRSYKQLMGQALTVEDIATDCEPIVTNADLAPYITRAVDNTLLSASAPAHPCGLIAKSLFTDSFSLYKPGTVIRAFG